MTVLLLSFTALSRQWKFATALSATETCWRMRIHPPIIRASHVCTIYKLKLLTPITDRAI